MTDDEQPSDSIEDMEGLAIVNASDLIPSKELRPLTQDHLPFDDDLSIPAHVDRDDYTLAGDAIGHLARLWERNPRLVDLIFYKTIHPDATYRDMENRLHIKKSMIAKLVKELRERYPALHSVVTYNQAWFARSSR